MKPIYFLVLLATSCAHTTSSLPQVPVAKLKAIEAVKKSVDGYLAAAMPEIMSAYKDVNVSISDVVMDNVGQAGVVVVDITDKNKQLVGTLIIYMFCGTEDKCNIVQVGTIVKDKN